jgi:hypothetical protein
LEELPDLSEAQVRPAPLVPSNGMPVSKGKEPRSPLPPAGKQGMTPKREAWLLRVAQEGGTSPEALERCRAHLSAASSIEVSKFFDQLSKSGVSALGRFL